MVEGLACHVCLHSIIQTIDAQTHAETKDTPDAPKSAKKELEKLGPLSLDEKITSGAFAVTVSLWIFGASIGVNAVAAALLGLTILLVTNVVKWKDCLGEAPAITATQLKLHVLRVTHLPGCILTASAFVRNNALVICCQSSMLGTQTLPYLCHQLCSEFWQDTCLSWAFFMQVTTRHGTL